MNNTIINLKELFEYLKENHSNLPTHVFETLGESIQDLENNQSNPAIKAPLSN